MKNRLFMLMATLAVCVANPVMAMEDGDAQVSGSIAVQPTGMGDKEKQDDTFLSSKEERDATRLGKINKLEEEKQALSKKFYELALNREYQNPSEALEMCELEKTILRKRKGILDLFSAMESPVWNFKKQHNQKKLQDYYIAEQGVRSSEKAAYIGNHFGYFEYNSFLLWDVVFSITPKYQKHKK